MKQIVLNIDERKVKFFKELIKNFDFVKIADEIKLTDEQNEFVDGLKESLNEVDNHKKGRKNLQSAREFINEL